MEAKKGNGKKARVKTVASKPKANGTAAKKATAHRKPVGIVAFMLETLQAAPITVKDVAAKAHAKFPDHKIESLRNTCRGVLARITKHGFQVKHEGQTYQIAVTK